MAPCTAEREKRAVARALVRLARPLICSHIRLDGDGIGSALGLAHVLRGMGARPHVVSDSRIPEAYSFLPGADQVGTSALALRNDYDGVVVLDVPERSRLGALRDRLPAGRPVISIDHHPANARFGHVNWVATDRSSVGEMLCELAGPEGWAISPEAATCLYVAIITDTGRFTYQNTTAASMRAAADLIDLGADHVRAARELYRSISPGVARLHASALHTLHFRSGGRVAVMHLTRRMFDETGVSPIDTQDFAAIPGSVRGVQAGVLLREMSEANPDAPRVKVSLRSREGLDVRAIAARFGGGGHAAAAGCEVAGTVEQAEDAVAAALDAALGGRP